MPKKVFFCFDHKNDMDRVLAVRDGVHIEHLEDNNSVPAARKGECIK